MRIEAYRLFEIVAWPAAAWCAIELLLRGATGEAAGMSMTAITGACAALTIVACRARNRSLEAATPGRIRP